MDAAGLRAAFPVLQRRAYLNAGSCGPLPAAAVRAMSDMLERGATDGRAGAYFERTLDLRQRLRASYAALVGGEPDDVALTTCTSEGIVRVLAGLDLRPGDEVLTSDEEHPGLLGPLGAARAQRAIEVRTVPLDELAGAIAPQTRLLACSHVSWISGRLAPDLSRLDVPVLLDGAQGVGAVPVDVGALGCAFYAGSGQKWLCGPIGTGMLWVSPLWSERLVATGPTHLNLSEPAAGLEAVPHAGAARHDTSAQSPEGTGAAAAALGVLAEFGWDAVHERAASLAAALADELAERGLEVTPRDRTTLVSWRDRDGDPMATCAVLVDAGVLVRELPRSDLLRASVGAWNDESDLERLLAALPA